MILTFFIFVYTFYIFRKYLKLLHTSVSSPLSICSRIISVYVLEPISGVLPPVTLNRTNVVIILNIWNKLNNSLQLKSNYANLRQKDQHVQGR